MAQEQIYKVVFAAEAQQFQQRLEALKRSWGVFTAAIEQTQGALWNATVLGFQMSIAGRNWAENLFEVANQADEIRLKLASFEQAVKTSGESLDEATKAAKELADQFQILPDQVANAMGLLLRKGFSIKDAVVILQRFADSAVNIGRDIADGLEAGASALLQERSVLLNSVGIAENISTAYNQYAKALHKSVQALTESEKRQALMNLVMQSTANRVGLAQQYLAGFRGQVQRLSKEWRAFVRDFGQGIGAAFTPFILGARVVLQLLNALPRSFRVLLGAMSTVGAMSVFLSGVLFLSISNILRFVTTVKKTLADTIKALQLAIQTYREANSIIAKIGISSAIAAKHLDDMALSMLSASAVAGHPVFAHFIENLGLIATDSNASRAAVTKLADTLRVAFSSGIVTNLAKYDVLRKELDAIARSTVKAEKQFYLFEASLAGVLRQLSGKRVRVDELVQIDPKTVKRLGDLGIEVRGVSDIIVAAEAALSGRRTFSKDQMQAIKAAVGEVKNSYLDLANAAFIAADASGKAVDVSHLRKNVRTAEGVLTTFATGLSKKIQLSRLNVDNVIDYKSFVSNVEAEFAKAGLAASVIFSNELKAGLEAGRIFSGREFVAGIQAIEAWPKGLSKAAAASKTFRLEGRLLSRAVAEIAVTVAQTSNSYKLAMTNMSLITRSTVNGIIALLQKLKLNTAALAVTDFIAQIAPTSIAKTLDGASGSALKAASRLGRESGTALAFAFTSSLQYIDKIFIQSLNKIKIGKLGLNIRVFGKEANAAFKYFTRGADDAAVAALALTDSMTLLGRALRYLNTVQAAQNMTIFGRVMAGLAGVILNVSNLFGFLVRAITALVSGVPIVGWITALLFLSSKFRSAMGTLVGSIVNLAASIVGSISTIVGATANLVSGITEVTGVSTAFKIAINGIVTVIELMANGFKQLANGIKYSSLTVRKWLLQLRVTMLDFVSKVPVIGGYFKVDKRALEQELASVRDELDRTAGKIAADQERYAQRMIDTWGPKWSNQLKNEFFAAKESFKGIEDTFNDLISNSKIASTDAVKALDAYLSYYNDLLERLKKGGAQTKDIAFVQEMITRLTKLREAVKETADEVTNFIQTVSDKSVQVDISLTPDAIKPFRELDDEIAKLKRDAEAKFTGADLKLVDSKIAEYELKKRNYLVQKYNEEFTKLYEDNRSRINDIIAKSTDDELVQLRRERENAIREAELRYGQQLSRYEKYSNEYNQLVAEKNQEIYALNKYYAERENRLLEEQLRKDKEAYLDHYQEILRMIASNNDKALQLWEDRNNGIIASIEARVAQEKALIDKEKTLGRITSEEAALRTAQAERNALAQELKLQEDLAKARLNNAKENARVFLDIELKKLELQRQQEIADINKSVADQTRKAKLIADVESYYSDLIAEKKKSSAYDVYIAEQEYENKISELRNRLIQKDTEIHQLQLEKIIATYNKVADAAAQGLSKSFDSNNISDAVKGMEKATAVLRSLRLAGEGAEPAFNKLSSAIDDAKEKLKGLVNDAIDSANSSLNDLQDLLNNWDADPVGRSLKYFDEFSSKLGLGINKMRDLIAGLKGLPEDVKNSAIGLIKPYVDDLKNLANVVDELKTQRKNLQAAIDSKQLSIVDEKKAKEEIAAIDSLLREYYTGFSSFISDSVDKLDSAINDSLAKRNIQYAESAKELESIEAQIAAAKLKLNDKTYEAELKLADERIKSAKEYYEAVKRNAENLVNKDEARKGIQQAYLDLLNAELDKKDIIAKQADEEVTKKKEIVDLSKAQLDLEKSVLLSSLRNAGLTSDIASKYVDVLTAKKEMAIIDEKINLAAQADDQKNIVDLERQRVELGQQYLDNVESLKEGLTSFSKDLANAIPPTEDLFGALRSLNKTAYQLGADVIPVVAAGLNRWINISSSVADEMKSINTILYGASEAASRYTKELDRIATTSYRAAQNLIMTNSSADGVAGALLNAARASEKSANQFSQLYENTVQARKSISGLLDDLEAAKVDSIFKNLEADNIDFKKLFNKFKPYGSSIRQIIHDTFYFDYSIPYEQEQVLQDYFDRILDTLESAKKRMQENITKNPIDAAKAADEYIKMGKEIAQRVGLSIDQVIDVGLIKETRDKLQENELLLKAKARESAENAATMYKEYINVLNAEAKSLGKSADDIIRTMQTISSFVNPFNNVDAEKISGISATIQGAVSNIIAKLSEMKPKAIDLSSSIKDIFSSVTTSVLNMVNEGISAIDRLIERAKNATSDIAQAISTKATVKVDVQGLSNDLTITPNVDTSSIASAVSQSVADAIQRAAASMAIEPRVIFNGEITEAPSLTEISNDIMPRVLSAIREELDRRKAIGNVNSAGSVC